MDKLSRRSKLSYSELMQAIDRLPPALDDAYHSLEMVEVIGNVARRYKLNKEEYWELSGLVYDVVLGLLPPPSIQDELKTRIKLADEDIGFVSGELDAFIFNHIRSDLNKFYGLSHEEESPKNKKSSSADNDPYREPIE